MVVTNVLTKVDQIFDDFLGYFKIAFYVKLMWLLFGQVLEILG